MKVSKLNPALDDFLAVRELYLSSFPEDERVPWDEQVERIKQGADAVFRAHDKTRTMGFAIVTYLPDELILLSYLAVHPTYRSQGVGETLFRHVEKEHSKLGKSVMLIEVEPATAPVVSDAYGDPQRRVSFYRKLGAQCVAKNYAMPDPQERELVMLDLYCLRLKPDLDRSPYEWVQHLWGPANYDSLDSLLFQNMMEVIVIEDQRR